MLLSTKHKLGQLISKFFFPNMLTRKKGHVLTFLRELNFNALLLRLYELKKHLSHEICKHFYLSLTLASSWVNSSDTPLTLSNKL